VIFKQFYYIFFPISAEKGNLIAQQCDNCTKILGGISIGDDLEGESP